MSEPNDATRFGSTTFATDEYSGPRKFPTITTPISTHGFGADSDGPRCAAAAVAATGASVPAGRGRVSAPGSAIADIGLPVGCGCGALRGRGGALRGRGGAFGETGVE